MGNSAIHPPPTLRFWKGSSCGVSINSKKWARVSRPTPIQRTYFYILWNKKAFFIFHPRCRATSPSLFLRIACHGSLRQSCQVDTQARKKASRNTKAHPRFPLRLVLLFHRQIRLACPCRLSLSCQALRTFVNYLQSILFRNHPFNHAPTSLVPAITKINGITF